MHAIIVHVTFKPGREADAGRELEAIVVPNASKAPGFSGGYLVRSEDGTHGISVELFDSLENATEEAGRRSSGFPAEAAVTTDSDGVFEVTASV